MNLVNCPRCSGCGEEWEPSSDVECIPAQLMPCRLCCGAGEIEAGVADLYRTDRWACTTCEVCERWLVCVLDQETYMCTPCWTETQSVPF